MTRGGNHKRKKKMVIQHSEGVLKIILRDRSFLMSDVWAEWNVYGYEIFFDKFVWVRNIFQQICMGTK